MSDYFDFCSFRAIWLSLLHLVIKWEVFTINHSKLRSGRLQGAGSQNRGLYAVTRRLLLFVSAICNIHISRLCYDASIRLSVRLSVTEVHWRIIANLGFKVRSHFIAHCGRRAAACTAAVLLATAALMLTVLLAGGSSRAMLASARLSCYSMWSLFFIFISIYFVTHKLS